MKTYPLFRVHIPVDDAMVRIRGVLESGYINEGEQVTELTNAMRAELRADNLILVNSCTSAITLALHLAGVDHNSEVITTPMTCVASNTPIVARGAKPIWADIDAETGMLSPKSVAEKITAKTKAIIVVAWAGTPPELDLLGEICRSKGIKLILDAAHAFGATYFGNAIHDYADFTCYSFQAIKHITTGDGGALVCKSASDYKRSKALKWFGLDRDKAKDAAGNWKGQQWDVDIAEAGYKFNMNNLTASVGLSQLPYIKKILNAHKTNAELYGMLFNNERHLRRAQHPVGAESAYWVYTMLLDERAPLTRDELLKRLNDEGIMAGVVHVPNDAYSAFVDYSSPDLPGVTKFADCQFSLPCGWWLSDVDVCHIASRVKKIVQEAK